MLKRSIFTFGQLYLILNTVRYCTLNSAWNGSWWYLFPHCDLINSWLNNFLLKSHISTLMQMHSQDYSSKIMKCYLAKAIYHVKAATSLSPSSCQSNHKIHRRHKCQHENSTTVDSPPERPGPWWQTGPRLLHQTRAAFITAIYADAALSSLMDELKERWRIMAGEKDITLSCEGQACMEGSHGQILLRDTAEVPRSLSGKH